MTLKPQTLHRVQCLADDFTLYGLETKDEKRSPRVLRYLIKILMDIFILKVKCKSYNRCPGISVKDIHMKDWPAFNMESGSILSMFLRWHYDLFSSSWRYHY